jgi:hypothetical protein
LGEFCKPLIIKEEIRLAPRLHYPLTATTFGKGLTVNTGEMAGSKNFLIWMGLWVAALMVLLPALGS